MISEFRIICLRFGRQWNLPPDQASIILPGLQDVGLIRPAFCSVKRWRFGAISSGREWQGNWNVELWLAWIWCQCMMNCGLFLGLSSILLVIWYLSKDEWWKFEGLNVIYACKPIPGASFPGRQRHCHLGIKARAEEVTQISGKRPTNLFSYRLHGIQNYPASFSFEILNLEEELLE